MEFPLLSAFLSSNLPTKDRNSVFGERLLILTVDP